MPFLLVAALTALEVDATVPEVRLRAWLPGGVDALTFRELSIRDHRGDLALVRTAGGVEVRTQLPVRLL